MSQDIYVVCEHLRGQIADITFIMLAGARELAKTTGGRVIAVLLGNNMSGLAANLAADQVLLGEHPTLEDFTSDAYSRVLAQVIKDQAPRAVFFGHTSIGTDFAGSLSMRLDLPLVTSVREFTDEGDFVSQICGGKIMAEGKLTRSDRAGNLVPGGYKPEQGQSSQPPQFSLSNDSPTGRSEGRAGEQPSDELRKELIKQVRNEIGPIATVDLLQWAPALPKNRSGKIMRRILRKIAENQLDSLGDTSTLADPAVVEDLVHNRANR